MLWAFTTIRKKKTLRQQYLPFKIYHSYPMCHILLPVLIWGNKLRVLLCLGSHSANGRAWLPGTSGCRAFYAKVPLYKWLNNTDELLNAERQQKNYTVHIINITQNDQDFSS